MKLARTLGALFCAGLGLAAIPHTLRAQPVSFPPDLVDAARREGKLVYYSANLADVEQPMIAAFRQRFPFIDVELVRIPNAQLIPRVQAEASTGRLTADVVETTDTSDAKRMESLFDDFAPLNASVIAAEAQDSKRFWPSCALPYVLAINTALLKKEPKNLTDLLDPGLKDRVGLVVPSAGGSPWAMALMERLMKGDDYWAKLAAQKPSLYLSSVPLMTAVASGEALAGLVPLVAVTPLQKQGAPVKAIALEDGIPAIPVATGIVKGAKNPHAAQLFVNWQMSPEGQDVFAKSGCASVVAGAAMPSGLEGASAKVWVPPLARYAAEQPGLIAQWNKTYNYAQ